MIPENFTILIEKLKNKTKEKEALWSKTSRDNEFKLDLGKGAITTDRWEDPETDADLIDIAVINDRGDRIDSICFSTAQREEYKELVELHDIAKRAFYKIDETFKNIFKELDSEKIIGKEHKTDDLPF